MKMFPILFSYKIKEEIAAVRDANGTSVVIALPWLMVKEHEPQALRNHSQTVQRLAERGGLSAPEMCAVLENRPYQTMGYPQAHARLKQLLSEWTAEREKEDAEFNAAPFEDTGGRIYR